MLKIEENLSSRKVMMSETSMAWGHSNNNGPLEMSRIQSDKALLVVNAARRLQDKYFRDNNLKNFFLLIGLTCPLQVTTFTRTGWTWITNDRHKIKFVRGYMSSTPGMCNYKISDF
jgi:hypothetical protein